MGLFSRRKRDVVDPEARSPQLGLKHEDLALLGQLQDAGAQLDQPRHVVHYCYFGSTSAAEAAAAELQAAGWTTELRPPLEGYPDQWGVVAEQHGAVLEPGFVRESTDLFEAVAARHGGEHDGWEASV